MHRRVVDLVHLDGHHLLQLTQTLLHLHGLRGLIAEALHERAYVGHLLLLVLIGTQLLFASLAPEGDILVVLHPVVDHTAAADLQRAVRHIINKGAVVAHQHHRPAPLRQQLLQPLDALDVEVVRRLVEQQHVGMPEQDLGQLDTHAPAARELARGSVEVGALKAEARQRALDGSLLAVRTQHQVALVLAGIVLHQLHIVVAVVVAALVQLALHAVEASLQLMDVGKGLLSLLAHRRPVLQVHHLRQVADGGVALHVDAAGSSPLLAADNLQQGRLAGAVLAHQGDAVARVHNECGVAEQWLDAKLNLQSFNRNHLSRTFQLAKVRISEQNAK